MLNVLHPRSFTFGGTDAKKISTGAVAVMGDVGLDNEGGFQLSDVLPLASLFPFQDCSSLLSI